MEKKSQHQIIIKTDHDNIKQKFPLDLMIVFAIGTLVGVIVIFCLFWGLELLVGS